MRDGERTPYDVLDAEDEQDQARQLLSPLRESDGPLPPGLFDRVLLSARSRTPTGPVLELTSTRQPWLGRVGIRVQVLADIARAAAGTEAGVQVVRAHAGTTERGLGVELDLVVVLGPDQRQERTFPALANAVRRTVRRALDRATGVSTVTVDLRLLDVVLPELPAADGV